MEDGTWAGVERLWLDHTQTVVCQLLLSAAAAVSPSSSSGRDAEPR